MVSARNAWQRSAILVLLGIISLGHVWAGTLTFTITERLGRTWTNETVTYPVNFPQGQCLDGSVRVSGPSGAQPVQLFNVGYWSGSNYVKSATLAFVVTSLAPQATVTYTVSYGSTLPPDPVPSSDLQYVTTTDYLQTTTTDFGARFRLGTQTYTPPAAAATVPGPLVALRNAAGSWYGQQSLVWQHTHHLVYSTDTGTRSGAGARALQLSV